MQSGRQKDNETAMFVAKQQEIKTSLNNSNVMPKPLLIRQIPVSNSQQFVKKQNDVKIKEKTSNPNITFHPKSMTIQQLLKQQKQLKLTLLQLGVVVNELVQRKHELLWSYETVVKCKKSYSKLLQNLKEQLKDYQMMLSPEYPQYLQQQILQTKNNILQTKKQISQIKKWANSEHDQQKYTKYQKQIFEYQTAISSIKNKILNNKSKIYQKQQKNKQKQKQITRVINKIYKLTQDLQLQDIQILNPKQLQIKNQDYQKILDKKNRLKNIMQKYEKNNILQQQRRKKIIKETQHRIQHILDQIQIFDQKIKLQNQITNKNNKISPIPLTLNKVKPNKQYTFDIKTSNNKKRYHTSMDQNTERKTVSVQSQVQILGLSQQKRQQLALRKKKIYTQLQKNNYFKNIENSQVCKDSKLNNSIYKQYLNLQDQQNINVLPKIHANSSASFALEGSKFRNHNKRIKQLKQLRNNWRYREICEKLGKKHLQIEEEADCDLNQLIYKGL